MTSKPEISLAGARDGLRMINQTLHANCGPLYNVVLRQYRFRGVESAVYDETSKDYDVILCLNHGHRCVSSVTGRYNKSNRSMELLSKTAPDYEGLKFNLYLRTIFIYLMCFVRPTIKTIYSYSLNPISTYAMYKHYNAYNPDLQEYAIEHKLTPSTFTLTDAKNFHTYFTGKYNTSENAEKELQEMLEEYNMEDLGWETKEDAIAFIMKHMKSKAIALELNLEDDAEATQDFLLHKLLDTHIQCEKRTIPTETQLDSTFAGTRRKYSRSRSIKNLKRKNSGSS